MKKITIALIIILNMPLFSQEESQISNIDIIENIEEIHDKLDKLSVREKKDRVFSIGYIPGRFRYLNNVKVMNSFLNISGDYQAFDGLLYPIGNGMEFFTKVQVSESYSFKANYYRYETNTHGLHYLDSGYRDEIVSSPIEESLIYDTDSDGKSDYYTYGNFFFHGINLSLEYEKIIIPNLLKVSGGPIIGFGTEEIGFSSKNISSSDKVGWRRNFISPGVSAALSFIVKNITLVCEVGYNHNIPLETWQPIAGIAEGDSDPTEFNASNLWFTIGPSISLSF